MLTPQEIADVKFVKAVFGGYDMSGVDDFLAAVGDDYAALYKENAILKGKLKVLVEKVEEYRTTEDAMRMALLTAQRMGEEITSDANKKKDEMLRNADKEMHDRFTEMEKRIADEKLRLDVAAKETAKFIEVSQMVLRKHSEFLSKLEAAHRVVQPRIEDYQAPEPQPIRQPTREEQITTTAGQIGSVMERMANPTTPVQVPVQVPVPAPVPIPTPVPAYQPAPAPTYEDEGEPTKQYSMKSEDDSITPRPKFDFDDLKFGTNFNSEE